MCRHPSAIRRSVGMDAKSVHAISWFQARRWATGRVQRKVQRSVRLSMHITMIGDGRLIRPLVILATRAGNTVLRVDEMATDVASCSLSEMMIVAGDRSA